MPTKEEKAIYNKEWREKNKEERAIYRKEYYEKNKEKEAIYSKEYKNKIISWKSQGIHVEDMEILYKWYNEATHCENCKKEFVNGKRNNLTKCVDHDHNVEFNNFRGILCSNCNLNLRVDNTSGTANIYLDKRNGNYIYRRKINKIQHNKTFKTKQEAIAYKNEFEASRIYFHL